MRQSVTRADADPPIETPGHGDQWQAQETTTMTKSINITVPDDEFENAFLGLTLGGYQPMEAINASAVPVYHETGTEHWRIETLAQKLFIASQEREALTPVTEVNKLEALACFWAAANFVNVSAALAHSYGDDGLPVGKDFDDFVENFLGKERVEELDAELSALGY